MKKVLFLSLFIFGVLIFSYAEDNKIITGKIEKIAEDGSYIVVSGQTISTTAEFVEDAYFEINDDVKIEVIASEEGAAPQAVNYEYDFDVDSESGQ